MKDDELSGRLAQLEAELRSLREKLESVESKRASRVERFGKLLVTHWVLVSVLAALFFALYAKLVYGEFGVPYLESYRSLAATRARASFYRSLGNRFMRMQDWEAAEQAYRAAVEINPNDIDAHYGIIRAEVFQPVGEYKIPSPEVVSGKIDYLLEHEYFREDPYTYVLKGLYYLHFEPSPHEAQDWFGKAIEKDAENVAGYTGLALAQMQLNDIEGCIINNREALRREPQLVMAHNNIGFCYLITLRLNKALAHLELASKLSSYLLTALNLGDAYRYAGHFQPARERHQWALDVLNSPGAEITKERFVMGPWTYNFMPLAPGDRETIKNYIIVGPLEQQRALVHYALCIDSALMEDFQEAEKHFQEGLRLEHSEPFKLFFANKMQSTRGLLKLPKEVQAWLEEHERRLVPP